MVHAGRLTWNLNITQLKRIIIFQTIIFRPTAPNRLVHSSRYSSRELPTKILMVLLGNTHTWVFNVLFFVFLFLRFKETLYAAALDTAASKATWPVESKPTGTTGGLSDGFAGIRMKLFGGLKVQVMKKIRTNNNIATNQYDYKSINISYIYKCTYTYTYIYIYMWFHLCISDWTSRYV